MHVFDCETGMQVIAPMEEMECDTLVCLQSKVVMRCGKEALLIQQYREEQEELEDIGMIELKEEGEDGNELPPPINFRMRGVDSKITLADEKEYDVVLLAQQSEEGLTIKILRSEGH